VPKFDVNGGRDAFNPARGRVFGGWQDAFNPRGGRMIAEEEEELYLRLETRERVQRNKAKSKRRRASPTQTTSRRDNTPASRLLRQCSQSKRSYCFLLVKLCPFSSLGFALPRYAEDSLGAQIRRVPPACDMHTCRNNQKWAGHSVM